MLAPTLVPIAVWAVIARLRWHDWQALVVPVALYGAVLSFQGYSYATGSTFGFLRFYIAAVPFAATLALLAVPDGALVPGKRRGRYAPPIPQPVPLSARRRWVFAAGALALAVSLPVTAWGMGQPKYAPQEYALGAVLSPQPDSVAERKQIEHRIAASFSTEREIADFLDRLNLPDSSVLTDTAYGFAVVAASAHPKMYVVPSDVDSLRCSTIRFRRISSTCSRCPRPGAAPPTRS
ncbi:MAG: hypothetical protein WAM92_22435, partial [Mycobacterium sp.]